jgi:hypothetical protein
MVVVTVVALADGREETAIGPRLRIRSSPEPPLSPTAVPVASVDTSATATPRAAPVPFTPSAVTPTDVLLALGLDPIVRVPVF